MHTLQWRDVTPPGGTAPISTSITAGETAALQQLAKDADVLEIGAAYGYSTVILAQVAHRVVSVDPHTWLASYGTHQHNIEAYGVAGKVSTYVESSNTALPLFAEQKYAFDLIFIDGDHSVGQVTADIAMAQTVIAEGGTIAMHDLDETSCPGVRQAIDTWREPTFTVDTLAVFTHIQRS